MTEKRYSVESSNGIFFLEYPNGESCLIGQAENVNVDGLIHIAKRLNCLTGENKELKEENERLCNFNLHKILDKKNKENEKLKQENDSYKNMFFEIVETALTDTNCKELYCKGILDIFDKANSLNQAREMIKEHLK